MKNSMILLVVFLSAFSFVAHASETSLTDAMALELGMTPVSKIFRPAELMNKELVDERIPDERKAEVVIIVNKAKEGTAASAQTMRVYIKGDLAYTFLVSTGKETKVRATSGVEYIATTPVGYFRPVSIWKEYQSSQWIGAQINFAIFFIGGIALHSTTPEHFSAIGRRDSGGCVRLMPEDAQLINELVLTTGLDSFSIVAKDNWVDGRRIVRNQVVGSEIPVASVNRETGVLNPERPVKSWDTLIIVKNIKD